MTQLERSFRATSLISYQLFTVVKFGDADVINGAHLHPTVEFLVIDRIMLTAHNGLKLYEIDAFI